MPSDIDVSIMDFMVAVLSCCHPLILEIAIVYQSACCEPHMRSDNALVYS